MTAVEWLHRFDPDASRQEIHGLLGQMLFSGEEGLKPTDALSGGETARLLFCRIMLQKPNVLVLDEPTNHLDAESVAWLDHVSALELDEVPESLLVVGAGPVGLELGQIFARFGSRVTIVNSGPQIAARADREAASELQAALEAEGIEVVLNGGVDSLTSSASGGVEAEVRNALQPLLQRHHHFHPRQVRADAAMNAEPESGMRIVLAVDQDLVGVEKFFGVTVGRRERQ